MKRLFGVATESFGGSYDDFITRVHPADVDAIESAMSDAIDQDDRYEAEFRIQPDDGPHKWVEARGQAIVDSDGKQTRMIGTIKPLDRTQ